MERRYADRRSRAVSLKWPERRSGFDRRRPLAIEHLRDSSAALFLVLALLNLLNLLDWRFTTLELQYGATEANPLMALFFGVDSYTAGLFKVAVMLGVSLAIWKARRYRRILEFAVIATTVYAALIVYHLVGIGFLLPTS